MELKPVASIAVQVAPPVSLGILNGSERRFISILGGTVDGPHFRGSVLAGGSDIQTLRPDGTIDLVARYALDLGEAGKVLVENVGIRRPLPPSAEPDARPYFRGTVRFQAPAGLLGWLNDTVFVCSGRREGGVVTLEIAALL